MISVFYIDENGEKQENRCQSEYEAFYFETVLDNEGFTHWRKPKPKKKINLLQNKFDKDRSDYIMSTIDLSWSK